MYPISKLPFRTPEYLQRSFYAIHQLCHVLPQEETPRPADGHEGERVSGVKGAPIQPELIAARVRCGRFLAVT